MDTVEVLKVGTDVKIYDAAKSGRISCVCIRENDCVTYDVLYWSGDIRKCEEFSEYEFKVINNPIEKNTIGFCNGDKDA